MKNESEDEEEEIDGSYLVDFRDYQFSQQALTKSKYISAAKSLDKAELKKKTNMIGDKKSLLLASSSTFSVCNNAKMLINIRDCKRLISKVSNGGILATKKEANSNWFFTVYFNPYSLMNILSLRDTRKKFRVTMDRRVEIAMMVHISDTKVMRFVKIDAGLYMWKPETNTKLSNK